MKVVTSFLLCYVHQSKMDYRKKKKNVGQGLGSMYQLLIG